MSTIGDTIITDFKPFLHLKFFVFLPLLTFCVFIFVLCHMLDFIFNSYMYILLRDICIGYYSKNLDSPES